MVVDDNNNTQTNLLHSTQNELNSRSRIKNETNQNVVASIFKLVVPTVVFFLGIALQSTIVLFFINKTYSDAEMEQAVGLILFIFNITLMSVIFGLMNGLEILGAAAYANKKNTLVGVYLWRSRIVCLAVVIVISAILYSLMVILLKAIKTEQIVIDYSVRFSYFFVASIFLEVIFRSNYVYINIANRSYVNSIIVAITIPLHCLWCFLFITVADLDTLGAGIAIFISQCLNALLGSIYISYSQPIPGSVFSINRRCFKDLWSYLRISLPSMLLYCAEWWALELLAVFALVISDKVYQAHIVTFNVYTLVDCFTNGFATSMTIMCTNSLGRRDVPSTMKYRKFNFIIGLIVQFCIGSLVFVFKSQLARLYLDDDSQIEYLFSSTRLIGGLIVLDMFQYLLNSFCKSCGEMFKTSTICLVGFYIVMPAATWLFAIYLEMELFGIWLGLGACLIFLTVCYLILMTRFDYNKISELIIQSIAKDNADYSRLLQLEQAD